jgi:hypothetical protein
MKDRRIVALRVVLQRRRRLDKVLGEALARQRAEQTELREEEQRERERFDAERARLDAQAGRLKSMVSSGTRIAPRDYQDGVHWREVLDARCRGCEAEWHRACAALEQKEAEIVRTIGDIRINQTRIDAYGERIDALCREAERVVESALEEESEESRRVRQVG